MIRLRKHVATVCATLVTLGSAIGAHAANECKVQYGYHTGSGASRQDHTQLVELNAGQAQQINRNQLNFVRNLASHKVEVKLNNKSLQLSQNQADPPAAYYLGATTLVYLKCLTSVSQPAFASPQQMVQVLKQAGQTPVSIAEQLRAVFNQTNEQIAALLKSAGYAAGQIAQALRDGANATAAQVAAALKAAGYAVDQVAAALKSAFNATAAQVAAALKAAGYAIDQVAAGVKSAFNATVAQAAAALKAAGYAVEQIAAALKTTYNATAAQVAQALRTAGYAAAQVAAALKSAFNATIDQVAAALKAAGYAIDQVAASIRTAFNATAAQVAAALRAANYTLDEIAVAMRNAFQGITREALEAALRTAGFVATEVAMRMDRIYGVVEAALAPEYSFAYFGDANRGPSNCYYPGGVTPYGGAGGQPLPLPVGRQAAPYTVTFFGQKNMNVVTGLSGLPSGVRASIASRGNCFVQVQFDARSSTVPAGTNGTGRLDYGRSQPLNPRLSEDVTFAWRTGPIPPSAGGGAPPVAVGGGGAPGVIQRPGQNAASPDLLATFTARLLRHNGNSRRISDDFCQNLPPSRTANADSFGVVNVPNVSWGVINSANVATGSGFRIELRANGQVIRSEQVGGLTAGASSTYTYARPQSQTRVIRVRGLDRATSTQYGPPGCYQMVMTPNDPFDWQDPPFEVRVDTTNSVGEGAGGEINNTGNY